jgi:transposase
MNPIEHVWDFIGRKINQHNPKCQNIDELRTAILQEWQQFPQERLRRLVRSNQERTSPTYSQRKNNPRQLHPHPQKQLCPKCGCPEMKCFVGAKPLHDHHALADRPMFMDDNARPHRARIVQHFLQQEAVQTIPWPAMSPDMNPIEHVWDFIGRKINQRNPKCQNIDEWVYA